MKLSYNNENLHDELILKIKEFIDSMEEFETTPFHQTESDFQKAFGVLSDNGNFNTMKRFTISVDCHKTEKKLNQHYINRDKTWLLLPMLAYSKYSNGTREISFGWLNQTFFIKF